MPDPLLSDKLLVRVLDEGGMVWESDDDSLDTALKAADMAIADYLGEP